MDNYGRNIFSRMRFSRRCRIAISIGTPEFSSSRSKIAGRSENAFRSSIDRWVRNNKNTEERRVRLHQQLYIFFSHNDFAWNLRKHRGSTKLQDFPFDEDVSRNSTWGPQWQTDLVRLRQGIVGAQFWSAYVPCEAQFLDAVQLTLEQIDVVRRLTSKYSTKIRLVTTSGELEKAHKDGVIASLVGIEGGHSIGTSMAVLRSFQRLGARYMTLTHKCNTPW